MLIRDPHLSESYFVSSFISGIKEEIKPMVKMLKPTTLIEAFEIAEWQEQSLALNRRYTRNTRNWEPGENSKSSSVSSVTNTGGKTSEVVGQRKVNSKDTNQESRKISPQELLRRKNNHLCFKCGERFSPVISANTGT